ncbi:winged helix-turn-helix domain-containing protein [Stenotrophomonas mori]|uniref:Winged helix-turn-helix domain-containing protein n=1 Tax=Stenotrophomonas mori TaxID=2871096 RepID=A0ABT0SIJ4_9GAMM|nr:winged helix-turn-helix domain-containing protein [Stenotrophomonas mori]MCL7715163.1 winged helix-turn-helix domain-containing protein [Stenotrophomonas mori]
MEPIESGLPPSDRLRIGDCLVILSSREVHAPGARRASRLTPKASGVLQVLARRAGEVVTRDELFAQVWPDTLPTNDVLTQAVTLLRKALSAGTGVRQGQDYIETIAKSGYRLVVPVAWEAEPVATATGHAADASGAPAVSGAGDPPPVAGGTRGRGRWTLAVLASAALLLCSAGLLAMMLWRAAPAGNALEAATADGVDVVGSPERPYRLITATRGMAAFPALSPDGALVVYADESEGGSTLRVQSTGSTTSAPLLDTPQGALDRFPAWSPDGREIAFARFHPDGGCEVLVIGATGGSARRATRCDGADMLSFSWMPDGRGLVFGSMTGALGAAGIRTLDLATGHWRTLDYARADDDFDYAPRYSPDGHQLAFVRNPQMGALWAMPAAGGRVRRITAGSAEMRGWGWLDDDGIVFGRRVDSESRLYRVDLRSGRLSDLGVDDAQSPSVARLGKVLVFVHSTPQFGLFRVPLDDPGRREQLFASSGRDAQPMIAPDGRQVVFTSNRSGASALWWGRPEHPDSLHPVEGLRPETRQSPDWSADSQQVLVSGRDPSGRPGIYEVTPEQGQWKRLPIPVDEPLQAVYGPSRDTLFVIAQDRGGTVELVLFDRSGGRWRRQGQVHGVSQVRYERHSARVLFTRLAEGGLWSADAALSPASIAELRGDVPSRWRFRAWAVGGDGAVGYLHQRPDCPVQLSRLDRPSASRCLDATAASTTNGFSIAPDGTAVYVALMLNEGNDIGVMPVPEPASRPLLGASKWLPWLGKVRS